MKQGTKTMKSNVLLLAVAVGAALVFHGCSQETTDDGYGSASVAALTTDDVARIQVTVTGAGIPAPIVSDLTKDLGTGAWSGTIDNIPVGVDRTFLAEAFDGADVLIYSGTVLGVEITEGVPIAVDIFLQQTTPPDPFVNTVPIFQSLVVSPSVPEPNEPVTLTVDVTDPDVGDTLTLAWSAPNGSLAPPTDQLTVVWTAPATAGIYTVTVDATDSTGATSTLTASIGVAIPTGSASVTIDLNTWPEVQLLVPSPTRIDVDDTTTLDLTASDPDVGDTLTYAWSAACTGTFSDTAAEDPSFTLDADNAGAPCALTVAVTDGRDGSNTATVNIDTGPTAPVTTAVTCPCWDGSSGSAGTSIQDVWATLAPANCFDVDSCSDNDLGLPSDFTTVASCRDDLGTQLQTNAQGDSFGSITACYVQETFWTGSVQTGTGFDVTITGLTDAQVATCRTEHDAFTTTTEFGGFENDPICGLPVPGSTPGSGVACAVVPPGLVLSGTDYAGIGSVNPNIRGQDCVDEVGLLYLDNGCPLTPSLERRTLCDQAFVTASCQSCLSVGSAGACTACRTEIESRFDPTCLGSGLPVCE